MPENQGTAPLDPTSPVGQVRLLVGDKSPSEIAMGVGTYMWFSDDEIRGLLALENDRIKMAAYRILMTVAQSQALILKKFTSADLAVDGPSIAAEIRLQAKMLRDEVSDEAALAAVDYVNVVPTGGPAFPDPSEAVASLVSTYPATFPYSSQGIL